MNIPTKYLAIGCIALCAYQTNAKDAERKNTSPAQLISNAGQIADQHHIPRSDVDFKIEHSGVTMFGGNGQLHYQWTKQSQKSEVESQTDNTVSPFRGDRGAYSRQTPSDVEIYRMDVALVGANPNAQVVFEDPTGYYESYYLAHTGENGAVAKGYSRVTYKNVYQGIDWVIYTPPAAIKGSDGSQGVKYDFVVHPGGNPADIRLRYDGATELKLVDGALVAVTPYGTITEAAPYSYNADDKSTVPSGYILEGNTLRFDVQKTGRTLVIDPSLEWATYYGGSNGEDDPQCATDGLGYVYLTGRTWSTSNIATTGVHQTAIGSTGGWQDAFLVKFDSSGTRIWGTYYGGTNNEQLNALYIDPYNNVYLGGYTLSSTGISTTGAHKTSLTAPITNQHVDGFIVKFNDGGQRLWGSYYGGKDQDIVETIHGDSSFIYIGGSTKSDTGIATSGTHQTVYIDSTGSSNSNLDDGFIAKFNHSGTRIWGTYYGGANYDQLYDIVTDRSGNIYIGGRTYSDTGIASNNGYDRTNGSSNSSYSMDGFLAKLNASGIRQWGTYYGGRGGDEIFDIALDKANNIYITGKTTSIDSIVDSNSKNKVYGGAFVAKFGNAGDMIWGQYVTIVTASAANNKYLHITTDTSNRLYLSGTSTFDSAKLDPCFNQFIPIMNHSHGMFIVVYDSSGSMYTSKVFGGNGSWNYGGQVAAYRDDYFYYSGMTNSPAGIATTGAHQTTIGGNSDLCLFKFSIDTNVYLEQPFKDTLFCKGQALPMKYIVTKQFKPGNVFSVQLSDTFGSFTNATTIGTVTATTGGTINCTIPNNILQSGNYKMRIVSTNPAITPCVQSKKIGIGIAFPDSLTTSSNTPICRQDTVKLYASSVTPGVTYAWSGPMNFGATTKDAIVPAIDTHGTFQYIVKAGVYGCYDYDTVTMVVKPLPVAPVGSSNSPVCSNDTLKLTGNSTTAGVTYNWIGANNFTSSQQNPVLPKPDIAAGGTYIVSATLNGCARADTLGVQIKPVPLSQVTSSNSPLCAANDTLKLNTSSATSGITYSWAGPNSFSSTVQNPVLTNPSTAASGNYIASVILNGCTERDTITVTVKPKPAITLGSNSPVCLGASVSLTASAVTGGTYNWWGPANFSSSLQNPSISSITPSMAGIYKAVASLNGCLSDTANVTVAISASTPKPTGSSNSPICTGQDIQLSASTIQGATYRWWGAASYAATMQNATRNNAATTHGGQYYVTASLNGCVSDTDTVIVVVDLAPQVNTVPLSGIDICKGDEATFLASGNNAGTSPQYNWLVNGIGTGVTTTTFKTTMLNNGDIVSCAMHSPGTCGSSYNDTSNTFNMIVKPLLTPQVSITADAGPSLFPNEPINFTAVATDAGNATNYQWKKNGIDIGGATGAVWGANANALKDGDNICVLVTSTYACPSPDTALSNCIQLDIRLSVDEVVNNNSIKVYPNPVKGTLRITSTTSIESITVNNLLGQQLLQQKAKGNTAEVDMSALPAGVYVVKVNGVYAVRVTKE